MAFTQLGAPSNFGSDSSPNIGLIFSYEKKRSGADMQYRLKIEVKPVTGASYFGYSIYCTPTINGSAKSRITLKSSSPSQWTSNISYTTAWYTVSNKTSGTTSVSFAMSSDASNRSQTFSYSMAIDPAASTFSVGNGTLGTAQTITVTKNNSAFTSTITYKCGSATGTIANKSTDTSISWTPPTSLASQNTTGTTLSCTLTFTTYSGTTVIGTSTKTITLTIPSSIVPTISSITVTDGANLSGTYGGYIQGKSTMKVVVAASGVNGSSITSYSVTANGGTYTSSSFTTGVINSTGTLTITAKVTDSRGRTATKSTTITVLSYATPAITAISAARCNSSGGADASGAYLKVTFSAAGSSLSSKNTITYKLEYKTTTATSWTTVTLSSYANNFAITNGSYVFAATTTSSYDIRITATDKLGGTSTKAATGGTTSRLFDIYPKGAGWAFGKYAETANLFDVQWNSRFRGTLTVDGTLNGYTIGTSNRANTKSIPTIEPDGVMEIGQYIDFHTSSEDYKVRLQADASSNKLFIIGAVDLSSTLTVNGLTTVKGIQLPNENGLTAPLGRIYGTYTDGTTGHIASISNNDNIVFGYGSYQDKKGHTNIYTNDILAIVTAVNGQVDLNGSMLRFNRAYNAGAMMITCKWVDGAQHDIVSRGSTGLPAYFGPADISKDTVTYIRGKTVRLYNHSGGGIYLGTSGSTAVTSDRNFKKDIFDLDEKYEMFFNCLNPVTYKYDCKQTKGHRDHIGFIAQDVEQALLKSKLTSENFAGLVIESDVSINPNYDSNLSDEESRANEEHYDELYSLRYEEFIALNTHMIQKCLQRIDNQESEIQNLKAVIKNYKEQGENQNGAESFE